MCVCWLAQDRIEASSTAASPAVESFVNSSEMLENQEYNNRYLNFVGEDTTLDSSHADGFYDGNVRVQIVEKLGETTTEEFKEERSIDSGFAQGCVEFLEKQGSLPWHLTRHIDQGLKKLVYKAMIKDEEAVNVDAHLYRSMIGSLMYLTASRPDIMFAVCGCARDLPFNLEAFSDNDYAGASLDRKSTTGGCQFLGKRLISWQCKKQTIVENSTTEAEYVAAANCCG
ncbi:hypothetical protein Tco_0892512 [Tanacetum coccineum]|uniref:Uncharacterized protein n=1 Tax=Tanacetum coccineum TaxID=301880 RepID=A0ABQ5C642_9ASTR